MLVTIVLGERSQSMLSRVKLCFGVPCHCLSTRDDFVLRELLSSCACTWGDGRLRSGATFMLISLLGIYFSRHSLAVGFATESSSAGKLTVFKNICMIKALTGSMIGL